MISSAKPQVTLFGGAGYIGSVLTRHLLEDGYRVKVFDNFLFGDHGIEDIDHPALDVTRGDLCDTCAVSSACINSEIVVLLGAIIGRRANDIRRTNMRDINLLASSVVLDAAIEHGANRFIFASTDSVYGLQEGLLFETSTPEPVSLYSRLKLRMEERVINAKQRDFHPTALRISTCHGFSPRMRFDLVANTFVRDAVCHKEINLNGGDQWRAMIHVSDAARAFMSCLNAHENLVSGEIFNVTARDQNIQLKQLANLVVDMVPGTNINLHEATPDLTDYRLSCAKIEKILDFEPHFSIEDGLLEIKEALERDEFGNPYRLKYVNT